MLAVEFMLGHEWQHIYIYMLAVVIPRLSGLYKENLAYLVYMYRCWPNGAIA
jgi:hypothetical protein